MTFPVVASDLASFWHALHAGQTGKKPNLIITTPAGKMKLRLDDYRAIYHGRMVVTEADGFLAMSRAYKEVAGGKRPIVYLPNG